MTVIINRVDLYDGAVAAKVAREEMEEAAEASGGNVLNVNAGPDQQSRR